MRRRRLLVDTACVARIAQAADSAWAERLIAGEPAVSLALLEPGRAWLATPTATAVGSGVGSVSLSGSKTAVHHAAAAGILAVVAAFDGGPVVALVDPQASGVTITSLGGLDPSCAPCRVTLDGVTVAETELFTGPAVAGELRRALDVAAVATTAEGLGAASAALDMAIAYALERRQYGRLIGTFQGLQHLAAEQHVLRETAWASVLYAAAGLEERTADAGCAAAIAKAHGSTAAKLVVEGALQIFGGVGFTREHDLHLLYRRALECACRFGGAREYELRVAEDLLARETSVLER